MLALLGENPRPFPLNFGPAGLRFRKTRSGILLDRDLDAVQGTLQMTPNKQIHSRILLAHWTENMAAVTLLSPIFSSGTWGEEVKTNEHPWMRSVMKGSQSSGLSNPQKRSNHNGCTFLPWLF